jgi:ferritin-like metal-binding protein YciE
MAETTARDAKLIQYLNEAYGKEKQLETVLQLQIKLAKSLDKKTIHKRLQDHLKETKAQARGLERRIKQLGGKAEASNLPLPSAAAGAADAVTAAANKAIAAAKGPVQALRGTSPQDNLLRNLRDAFWNEAEEIAHYTVIEAVAEQLGDKDTAKLAREFRRQEERMQAFVSKQLAGVTKDVIKAEVPKEERAPAAASSSRRRSTTGRSRKTTSTSSRKPSARASSSRKPSSSAASSSSSSSRSRASSSGGSSSKRSGGAAKRSSGSSSRRSSGSSSRRSGGSSSSS